MNSLGGTALPHSPIGGDILVPPFSDALGPEVFPELYACVQQEPHLLLITDRTTEAENQAKIFY